MKDPKPLTINNVVYAHYVIEGEMLHIKVREQLIPNDKQKNEDLLIELIGFIEKKKLPYAAYLNIK